MKGYQIKITIKGSKPPVWRRVIVPEQITFYQLHRTIQLAFGWVDSHLHEFEFPGTGIRIMDSRNEDSEKPLREEERIDSWIKAFPRLTYIYDFGDWWEHRLLVEKVVEYSHRYPTVVQYKGDNLCEDCGGIGGYYEMTERPGQGDEGQCRQADSRGMDMYDMEAVNRVMEQRLVFERRKDDLPYIYRQYDVKELKRLAKLHCLPRYSGMKKGELILNLAGHVQKREVMERYFLLAGDEEIQVFEAAAAQPGEVYDPGEGSYQYLHNGGYYGVTNRGCLVAAPSVAQAYQAVNTEKFHKRRRRAYLVWAYMEAALYLYGAAWDAEIAALFNLYENDALTIEELHSIAREIQGLRSSFKYKNGLFYDMVLEEGCRFNEVLRDHEGKEAFIPPRDMVLEIARLGMSEPRRQLRPWLSLINKSTDIDPVTAFEAAAALHHRIRIGCGMQEAVEILEDVGVILEPETEQAEFGAFFKEVWNKTRMIGNYGFTPEELEAGSPEARMDAPCPCGSGKRYRQ